MLGYLLARAGIDVVVLEKWPDFFRDFRGDTIHPSTMEILHELGLLEEFLKLPHNETHQVLVHIGGKERQIANFDLLKARAPYIAFIPQWDFLNFISRHASAFPGFHLRMGTEATDIIFENGRAVGVRAKNAEGAFDIRAEVIVGADGRHSTIREKAGLIAEDLGAPIDVLWFRVPRTETGAKQSFGYIDSGRFMVMLDRDEYWQCAFVIRKGTFEEIKAKGIEQFRKDITVLASDAKLDMSGLNDWDQVKMLSVAVDRLKQWYKEGVVCIGDSAHAMSPVGGVGINLAVQDAIAAGNILVPAFRAGVPGTNDFARIQKRRELPTKLIQRMQVSLHRHVVEPILTRSGKMPIPWPLRVFSGIPALQGIPARIIGIGFRPEHIEIQWQAQE
jgi:2-polyprenyl-6-methoxyphenol hydroxylase-like FAD-dependent oxidoreductase